MAGDSKLTKELIDELFVEMNSYLTRSNKTVELVVCGGTLLVFEGARTMTADIDCFYRPSGVLADFVRDMWKKHTLSSDWLNIDVNNAFSLIALPRRYTQAWKQYSNLTILRVTDEVLLIMKLYAARDRTDKSDVPDVMFLLNKLNLKKYSDIKKLFIEFANDTAYDDGTGNRRLRIEWESKHEKFLKSVLANMDNRADFLGVIGRRKRK
jgi:hypothetical protein